MQRGEVDLCIVGTDRTTRNGDVCNKIGTYLKALAARDCGVPFYVAVPSPSIDWTVGEPSEIPIEERSGDELRFVTGRGDDRALARVEIVPAASPVANPAFDVTPRRLITGLITERGVAPASSDGLRALFPEAAGAGRAPGWAR
jgi:methylthioribose-1-phosphate isomerase